MTLLTDLFPGGIDNVVEDTTPQLGGNLDMHGHNIGGNTETQLDDAVTKKHAANTDTALGAQSENLDMNTHKIVGVVDPTANQEVATKKYVDDNKLWTDGGTYSYLTEEAGNTRLHNTGLLSLEATGGTTHPLITADKWGYSSSFTEKGDRLLILGTGSHTSSPAVWIEKDYISNGTPTGDPTIPVGLYVGHEHTGSGVAFTHSIMGYALNNGTGNNDVVGVSGRARKKGAGIGDACGVWGSAYNDVNQNGGIMALEGSIYQNAAGMTASDSLGDGINKWSVGLHINSHSTGSNAKAGIAIDGAGTYRMWNAILVDKNAFPGAGTTGTVGINMADCDDTRKPQYGIKFGKAHAHIHCTDSLALQSTKSFFSYIGNSENFIWRKGTYSSHTDCMYLDSAGSLFLDGVVTENSWTLRDEDIKNKWVLMKSIRDAYKTHDGKNLHPALQAKTVMKNSGGVNETKYGKRPSDFLQVAIECIAELKDRIKVLENNK